MKILFLTIISIFIFSVTSFSQSNDWELYSETNGVMIYTKYTECHYESDGIHREYVLIKLLNTTNQNMQVDFDYKTWFNGKCFNCNSDSPEFHRTVDLPAGETTEGVCDYTVQNGLKLFSKHLNYNDPEHSLSKFELQNIRVIIK
jgi:hypothetical protein